LDWRHWSFGDYLSLMICIDARPLGMDDPLK
jgi:hypothetical protein